MDRGRPIAGFLLVAIGATLFASKAILVKLAYMERPDALLMLVWRMIFALPFFVGAGMLAWLLARTAGRRTATSPIVRAAAVGMIGYYIAMYLDFAGLLHVTARLERLALFTYPIFLLFLGALFFGTRLTPGHLAAAALSYAGLAFVFLSDLDVAEDGNVPLGTALVLGSAIAFALYQLLAKSLIAELGSVLFTSVALSAASAASLIHGLAVLGPQGLAAPGNFLWLAAAAGILATVIPSYFVNEGLARIGPESTALISFLSPLLTIAMGVAVLREHFSLMDGLGTCLVCIGVGYHTWRELRTSKPQVVDSTHSPSR